MTKAIFDGEMITFSPFDSEALAILIRKCAHDGCRMLEVGSWLGCGSTQVFLRELNRFDNCSLYCVDTWLGSPNVARHQAIVGSYDVFATFMHNVASPKQNVTIEPVTMTSSEAAPRFEAESFDLIFIDADHSFSSVQQDIAAWRNKVRRGGILCGHDAEERVTDKNRSVLERNKCVDTISGTERIPTIHPGSILAVHEAFDGAAELWAERPIDLQNGSTGCSSIWFYQMR